MKRAALVSAILHLVSLAVSGTALVVSSRPAPPAEQPARETVQEIVRPPTHSMIVPGISTFRRTEVNPHGRGYFGNLTPISSRNFWCQNGVGSSTSISTLAAYFNSTNHQGTYRTKHYFPNSFTNLRCVFCNTAQDPGAAATAGAEPPPWAGGTDIGGTLTIQAWVEYTIGGSATSKQLFFNGSSTLTLAEGAVAMSDPALNWRFDPSIQGYFWIRTQVSVSAGVYWPVFKELLGTDGEGYADNSLIGANTGSTGFTTSGMAAFCPIMCLGSSATANQPVIGVLGDSIVAGAKNNYLDGVLQGASSFAAGFSWIDYLNCGSTINSPSLTTPTYPLVKASRSSAIAQADSESTTSNNAVHHSVRFLMLQPCSHCIIAIGRNDLNNGVTAATLEGYVTKLCNYCKAIGVTPIVCTVAPDTTSTDNWATATNQTVTSWEAQRTTYNAWVRAGCGGAAVGWDVYAPIEVNASNVVTRDGGRWYSDGTANRYTEDGIHPANKGNIFIAANATWPALTVWLPRRPMPWELRPEIFLALAA